MYMNLGVIEELGVTTVKGKNIGGAIGVWGVASCDGVPSGQAGQASSAEKEKVDFLHYTAKNWYWPLNLTL